MSESTPTRLFPTRCPNCGGARLFTRRVESAGGYGPHLLAGLNASFWRSPKFDVVLCADCGHTLFFADEQACEKVPTASSWRPVYG